MAAAAGLFEELLIRFGDWIGEEMSIPHLFRCPISLDIFTDPVTLCTGQTYDRPCIERWLAAGHRTCPVTMQPLGDATALVPNRTLRHLIERWLSTDQHHHHHLPEPAAPAAEAEADAEEPSLAALKPLATSHRTLASPLAAAGHRSTPPRQASTSKSKQARKIQWQHARPSNKQVHEQ
uniref:U-box domain-containing protein n=1 Tax=Oryza barthii TaxID=65489 RepID=A0A0D3FW43_9ORYZ